MLFSKYFLNSLKTKKFIYNRDSLENRTCSTLIKVSGCNDEELQRLGYENRLINRKKYTQVRLNYELLKLWLIYIPATIIGVNVYLWSTPDGTKTVNLDQYTIKRVVFDEDEILESKEVLALYDRFGRIPASGELLKNNPYNRIDYFVKSNEEEMEIYFDINKGEITYNSTRTRFYKNPEHGVNELNEEYKDEYVRLFDELEKYYETNSTASSRVKKKFKELTSDEKCQKVIEINEIVNKESKLEEVYKSKWIWESFFALLALFYGGFEIDYIIHKGFHCDSLKNNNGLLEVESEGDHMSLHRIGQYKDAFIAAEKRRIELLDKHCSENGYDDYQNQILTRFEKEKVLARSPKKIAKKDDFMV